MAEIFISYAHADREKAERLAEALTLAGYTVWWDRQVLGGAEFADDIERELENAKAVIAAWSAQGSKSRWVKDEATIAAETGKLVTVSLDGAKPPIGFRQFFCIDMGAWRGGEGEKPFADLKRAVQAKIEGVAEPVLAQTRSTSAWHNFLHITRKPVALAGFGLAAAVIVVLLFFLQNNLSEPRTTVTAETEAGPSPKEAAPSPVNEKSVAVLAFEDFSPDGDNEWFANGLSEEIIHKLAQIPGIHVIARTSAFSFKDKNVTHTEMAQALNVAHIVEGSVRRSDDRLRITAQLIRANDGFHIWSKTYDGSVGDVFDVQEDVAANVAQTLDILLDDESLSKMRGTGTRNVDAYEYFLRGVDLHHEAHNSGVAANAEGFPLLWTANEWFDKAIEADPDFAAPYFLRADAFTHFIEGETRKGAPAGMTSELAFDTARKTYTDAADRATDEASRLIFEIHKAFYNYDWATVSRLLSEVKYDDRAYQSLTTVDDIIEILIAFGRPEDALKMLENMIEHDPLNLNPRAQVIQATWAAKGAEAGLKRLYEERKKLGQPDYFLIRELILLSVLGRYDEALAVTDKFDTSIDFYRSLRAYALANADRRSEAEELIKPLMKKNYQHGILIQTLISLGRIDEAREMSLEMDAIPGRATQSARGIALGGGGTLLCPPEWTPNLTRLFKDAGVDHEVRASVLEAIKKSQTGQ